MTNEDELSELNNEGFLLVAIESIAKILDDLLIRVEKLETSLNGDGR